MMDIIIGGVVCVFVLAFIGLELFEDYMDERLAKSNENLEIFIGGR